MPELMPTISEHNICQLKNSLQQKIYPIGEHIPVYGFPILEVPESFHISENPERHLKARQIVEIHEAKQLAYNPEECLF